MNLRSFFILLPKCIAKISVQILANTSTENTVQITAEICKKFPTELLIYLKKHSLISSLFLNMTIALRLFLTLPVTVCEAKRSFSKLARIKNYCRSMLRLEKLNALAILSIEPKISRSLSFEDVVDDFARSKVRKKPLN